MSTGRLLEDVEAENDDPDGAPKGEDKSSDDWWGWITSGGVPSPRW